jgi:PAS domain S-box-containing protein
LDAEPRITIGPVLRPFSRTSDAPRISRGGGSQRQAYALAMFGGVLIAVMMTLWGIQFYLRTNAAVSNAKVSAQNLAEVLAEHTARTFEALDRTLQQAAIIRRDLDAGRFPTSESALAALRHLKETSPAIIALGWTDAAGKLEAHTYEGAPPRPSLADLPHFTAQRDAKEDRLFIAPPLRSAANGRWITAISRRLSNADGSFAGIVVAPIDQDYFARTYRMINLGEHGVVALADLGAMVLFRVPFDEKAIGKSFRDSPLFAQHIPQAPRGSFEAVSVVDGLERIVGYKVVTGQPLVVLVSYRRDEILQPLYSQMRTFSPLFVALVGVMLIGVVLLFRQARKIAAQSSVLELTLENMDQGLFVRQPDGTLPIYNRRALELTGLAADFMATNPSAQQSIEYQRQHGEFDNLAPEALAEMVRAARSGRPYSYERQRPNGTVVEVRGVPMPGGGLLRTFTDVTRRKREEERIRALLEAAPDAMVIVDAGGRIVRINAQTEKLFGYARAELLGEPVEILIPEGLRSRHPQHRAGYFADPHVRAMGAGLELRGKRKDGREFPVAISLSPLRTESGIIVSSAIRDISEQKAAEQALQEAKQRAEAAANAKSEFLANMSHELRTPLTAILGVTDLLLAGDYHVAQRRDFLELQRTAGRGLLTLINDVLDFSRIEAGQLAIENVPFSLRDKVKNCTALVADDAARKGLELTSWVADDVPDVVLGDPVRLRQVLVNLLANAVKFTDRGAVRLTLEKAAQGAPALRFAVSDSGIGIAAEKLPLLFDRFVQADSSTTRRFGGTGLGLAISKRLAALMGGRIEVESKPDSGSTFSLTLELREPAEKLTAPAAAAPAHRACRILLAEDNDLSRQIISTVLAQAGHDVTSVSCGTQAIAAASLDRFDLVLMDIQMPGMDGYAAARAIRAAEHTAHRVPIIALSANPLADEAERCRDAGMDLYVPKPVDWPGLFAAMVELIEESSRAGGDADAPADEGADAQSCAVLDDARLDELRLRIGAVNTANLLQMFETEARARFAGDQIESTSNQMLAQQAHNLAGAAGMLGFVEFMLACRALEAAVDSADDLATAIERCCAARDRALAEIARRRGQGAVPEIIRASA